LIGKAYLAAYPDERDRRLILKELIGPTKLRGPGDLRRRIAQRRQQDFIQGAVAVVDGWILAKSEARAAALTVLL
jgi:DNA-binding IclR family transcriptional regulator